VIVAVIGERGNNAVAWSSALIDRGHEVRSLTRSTGFDLDAPENFAAALDGVDVLTLTTPADPLQVERETTLIDAAVRAGVERIVKLSVIGAERAYKISPFARWHARIECALHASGVPYVILRPNFYMQNLLRQRDRILAGTYAEPLGDARVSYVDVRDIGRVAACVCDGGYDGQALTLTGSRALSGTDVAEALTRALDRDVAFASPDRRDVAVAMLERGRPLWHADATLELYRNVHHGRAPHVAAITGDVQRITGTPPRTLEAFAREAFRTTG
jgi:uncharacterized protein YbjT (DUF2867 family)